MALEILNDKIHIQRTYKNFQLNISIDQFPLSGLIVFFGVSGSGKSVTLKEIFLNCQDKKVWMNPYTNFYSSLKVKDFIAFSKGKEFIYFYYQQLNIQELLDTPINKLSKGEQRRLYFYMCISTKAKTYFFDEPFSFLDEKYRSVVAKIIEELSQNHLVFVATHQNEWQGNQICYELQDGKIIKQYVKSENKNLCIPIFSKEEKYDKKVFYKQKVKTILTIALFTLIIQFFSLAFSGFNYAQKQRIAIDTLGIFNAQNGVLMTPQTVNIDKNLLYETYQEIIEEEELELVEEYQFAKDFTLSVLNSQYRMDQLYCYNSLINEGYFASSYNPWLIEYFKTINPSYTNIEIQENILKHDFIKQPITLTISGYLYDSYFQKEITITGILEDNPYFFASSIPTLTFFQDLNDEIIEVESFENLNDEVVGICFYPALLSKNTSEEYLNYLSYKYPQFVYTLNTKGLIVASNKKNITIQSLQDYFLQQEDVFAFSFHNSNYYYLKDVDFFKENHFSYIGELKLEKNKIIVSLNYALRYFQTSQIKDLIGKKVLIQNKEWEINCILDQVNNDFVYFYSSDYLTDIAPLYANSANLLIKDYLNVDNVVKKLNQNSLGAEFKLTFDNQQDYFKNILSLQYAKENLSRTKKFWILFAVIIFSLFIVFIGLLILQSYRLYTTLDWLYISMTKEKIIITIIGCIVSFLVAFIFYDWLVQICNQTLFYEFNQNLKNFPIFDKKITMDYNWYLLFISFIILGIGEFFNGKKIQRFFKKLFKKV